MLSQQVFRYIVVGALGTAAHLAVLALAVEYYRLGVVVATVAGFLAALAVSYGLNHYWTFQSQRHPASSFWRYLLVCLSGLLLNTAMVYTMVEYFGWWYLTAQLCVILVVPTSNYLLNKYWAFNPNTPKSHAE